MCGLWHGPERELKGKRVMVEFHSRPQSTQCRFRRHLATSSSEINWVSDMYIHCRDFMVIPIFLERVKLSL